MLSVINRRSIQFRTDVALGWDAMDTSVSVKSGYFSPHIQAFIPPIEKPNTIRKWRMPRPSVTSLYSALTMS
jgi:hypothetical protein